MNIAFWQNEPNFPNVFNDQPLTTNPTRPKSLRELTNNHRSLSGHTDKARS
jgi:hypothetical protein